ncbi:MAG: MMPL family transporter [Elusimicrobiota bacterium]|jgi:hypothetical protein
MAASSSGGSWKETAKAWWIRTYDRSWVWYDRFLLGRPALSLLALALLSGFFLYNVRHFRLDASGDTLVLEHDEDLRYYRQMSSRYESGDYAIITYTPPEDLFSKASLDRLRRLRAELRAMPRVASVVSILDVPLMWNPPGTLKELKDNIKTLEDPRAKIDYAVEEFRNSPIYRNLLVGESLKTSAVIVNFKVDKAAQAVAHRRLALREKRYATDLSDEEEAELAGLEESYRANKDENAVRRHEDVTAIRGIIAGYQKEAKLFLGGIPMIVEDIMRYVRSDIIVFGVGMLGFVMLSLGFIYRHPRWVFLPMLACVASVLVMMGGIGLIRWEVTVVSSNFVSLQIILTMSLAIHIVSRYRELLWLKPGLSNRETVLASARDVLVPCMYCNLTTIAGFNSLILCDILPVTQFGWMMGVGLLVSMVIVFWFLPSAMVLLPKPAVKEESEWGAPTEFNFARLVHHHKGVIYAGTLLVAALTTVGIFKLQVENSFINYFRKSTPIYQGMKFIDDELGGTTPLDIVLKLEKKKAAPAAAQAAPAADDEFSGFSEFEGEVKDDPKYWYTSERLATIEKVHDYAASLPETGKVLSLATLYKTARSLNEGKDFDDFSLALLFNTMKGNFREILVSPYVNIEGNEARVSLRVRDSLKSLRRGEFISRVKRDLVEKLGIPEDQFRVSGLMLLYNNMLQSLYASQIKAILGTLAALLAMFLILFRSLTISLVALAPQFLACLAILGVMGLAGLPLDVMTITIVSISVGIGVDDAIHYVYRFQEEVKRDRNYLRAMYACHLTIGNAMLYTSLVITIGFSILAFSKFIPTVLFGILTGVAMMTACISSQVLLPALILLVKPFGPGTTELPEQQHGVQPQKAATRA